MTRAVFHISRSELSRRLKAFTALAVSWLGVQTYATVTLPPAQQLVCGMYTALLAGALLIIGLLTAYFFRARYARTTVEIQGSTVVRKTPKATYKYNLANVVEARTVMTTRGLIRQISFLTQDGARFTFDGLQDFDDFRKAALRECRKARQRVTTEPLDYDHVLFYPVLGMLLGLFITFLILGAYSQAWLVPFLGPGILLFCVATGLFFAGIRPVARQYGARAAFVDYVIAAVLFVVVVLLVVV